MSTPVWICIGVYVVGFLVAPFVVSLTDGWPFVEPRIGGCDGSVAFFLALLWPLGLVVWGLYVWWVLCSATGAMAHKALMRELERVAK